MTKTYSVPPEQLIDWEVINEIQVSELEAFQSKLEQIEKPIISGNALYTVAKSTIKESPSAKSLVRQLLIIGELKRSARSHADEVVSDIVRAVLIRVKKSKPNIYDEFEKKLGKRQAIFSNLISSQHVRASAKAIALSYMESNIFRDGVIINDLRPIYDEERKQIDGFVICQHMHIEFTSSSGKLETLTIALDKSDIETLQEILNDALNKIEAASVYVDENTNLDSVVAGSETYGLRD